MFGSYTCPYYRETENFCIAFNDYVRHLTWGCPKNEYECPYMAALEEEEKDRETQEQEQRKKREREQREYEIKERERQEREQQERDREWERKQQEYDEFERKWEHKLREFEDREREWEHKGTRTGTVSRDSYDYEDDEIIDGPFSTSYSGYIRSNELAEIITNDFLPVGLLKCVLLLATALVCFMFAAGGTRLIANIPETAPYYNYATYTLGAGIAAITIFLTSKYGWRTLLFAGIAFALFLIRLYITYPLINAMATWITDVFSVVALGIGLIPGGISGILLRFITADSFLAYFLPVIVGGLFGTLSLAFIKRW